MTVHDLLGRPGVVYEPSDLEANLPLDEPTNELKDYLSNFKTLEDYMRMDENIDPELNSKQLLQRCKLEL